MKMTDGERQALRNMAEGMLRGMRIPLKYLPPVEKS